MATTNSHKQYQTTQVQTAGPAQLTLMCFDGAAKSLTQAHEAMAANRYEAQSSCIGRAQALLGELLSGLDFEQGGHIAQNLSTLYRYFYNRLTQANINDDIEALTEVKKAIVELRDTWAEAMDKAGAQGEGSEPGRRDFALSA